jgi:methyltransferase (TIGR00027 family)
MESGSQSRTAIFAAIHRAAHYLIDHSPILGDSFARAFAGFASDRELLAALDHLALPDFPGHRVLFALRSRYAEDELAAAAQSGTSQYIILGAGLDSYAYRRPDAMRSLRIYEVDHPASQTWKRGRLAELGIDAPPTLRYVPVDFEHETLADGLAAGGVDRNARAFFSWLGVTQYLTRDVVLSALREIASATVPGSELVASFVVPVATLNQEDGELLTAIATRTASVGEPWLSFFEPGQMDALLTGAGYEEIYYLSPERAAERYLLGRTDCLRIPGYSGLIKARVA